MDSCGKTGLVYCPHCQEFVTRSTFRRHQLLRVESKRKRTASSSSSDSNGDSVDSDPAYLHGEHRMVFFVLFLSPLFMLALIALPSKFVIRTMVYDPKTFDIFFPQ